MLHILQDNIFGHWFQNHRSVSFLSQSLQCFFAKRSTAWKKGHHQSGRANYRGSGEVFFCYKHPPHLFQDVPTLLHTYLIVCKSSQYSLLYSSPRIIPKNDMPSVLVPVPWCMYLSCCCVDIQDDGDDDDWYDGWDKINPCDAVASSRNREEYFWQYFIIYIFDLFHYLHFDLFHHLHFDLFHHLHLIQLHGFWPISNQPKK